MQRHRAISSLTPLPPPAQTAQRFLRSVVGRLPPTASDEEARAAVSAAALEFLVQRVDVQVRLPVLGWMHGGRGRGTLPSVSCGASFEPAL